jgi:alkanesulfonate monooxygenase SsuD/methylene tetrahydromethanopterin reductase-like flavin-dependent oxidoreductase (luciferase family)
MRLGLGPISLRGATRESLAGMAAQAVASFFDAMWVAESREEGAGGGLAAAALLAQAVPIRLGAVVDVGLYHPLFLAEDIAVADLTSEGRIEVILRMATGGQRDLLEEHIQVLALALSGAHVKWTGKHLHVPAGIEANQPAPRRLALNPRPAQPAVPIWIESSETWVEELSRRLGFGVAARWRPGAQAPAATGRWPGMLLCDTEVQADDLLSAAGEGAGYFVVAARNPQEAALAGRRLAGPLRMPEFPEWINADQPI